jgi:Domain of unknown function (DUF4124)
MKALAVTLVAAIWLASAAAPAAADGRRGHVRGDFHGARPFDRRHHHGFGHRPFFPVFVAPSVVVVPPFLLAPGPAYAPPAVYAVPPVYAALPPYAAPVPPPLPRVVEFPTGRYELRGDGVYSPYTWVWIPYPPVAPLPPPPPSAPPAPPAAAPEPTSRRPPAQTAQLYRWTDEQGVTTWTDSLEKVPARYRAQTSRLSP